MDTIKYDDFAKIDLRVAKIIVAERVEGSDKLLKLQVEADIPRQIIAGIGKSYEPENLVGKNIVIVANLEPRELMGLTSQGMLLAGKDENGFALLVPEKEIKPGGKVN
jgi:methionyl-tRNA synthetase